MYSTLEVGEFSNLFKGNDSAYGVTVADGAPDEHGKVKGTSRLVYETPDAAVFSRHLSGEAGIGIAPICDDSRCFFGAVDIDGYKWDLMDVVRAIYDFDMPICPCYSKSRHLHLYVFFASPAEAEEVQELLRWYAVSFACPENVEVFPKQKKVSKANKFYSWINLPYFDAESENCRKMVNRDGSLASLADFIERAKHCRRTMEEHKECLEALPYYGAPPCIRAGAYLRDIGPGERNTWLFAASVFLRLKDENAEVEDPIKELNKSLKDPLPEEELLSTVLKSIERNTYFYPCAQLGRCDKKACRASDYGIASKSASGLNYGPITQVNSDPPYYEWEVNGQKMRFFTENDILKQTVFRAQALRYLHLAVPQIKESAWLKIVQRAFDNIRFAEDEAKAGVGNELMVAVSDFFNGRLVTEDPDMYRLGRVGRKPDGWEFDLSPLLTFVGNARVRMDSLEVRARLMDKGMTFRGGHCVLPYESVPVLEQKELTVPVKDVEEGVCF